MGKDNTVRHSFSPDSGVKNLRGLVALFEDILIDGGKRRIGVLGKFKPVVADNRIILRDAPPKLAERLMASISLMQRNAVALSGLCSEK